MLELFNSLSLWEGVAVVLAIAYLLLAARENILCWYCALLTSAIYTALFWQVSLFMESVLNIYYMVMAVYGWQQWRYGGTNDAGARIRTLSGSNHCWIIGIVLLLSLVNGYWLSHHTSAAWPYVDAFMTWASVITTWMVARKILENWIYWMVIDSLSIPLYINRGLYLTAILFVGYVIIVVFGYLGWRRHYLAGNAVASANA